MSGFVEQERKSGIQYLEDLRAAISTVWQKACEFDGMPPETKFAMFSKDNRYAKAYNDLMRQYREGMTECTAYGYTGMRIANGRAQLYKRTARKQSGLTANEPRELLARGQAER